MDNERSAVIQIGGIDYKMILTTKATKEIAGRYGGLENLGQKLMKSENFEMALDEIVWLPIRASSFTISAILLKRRNCSPVRWSSF